MALDINLARANIATFESFAKTEIKNDVACKKDAGACSKAKLVLATQEERIVTVQDSSNGFVKFFQDFFNSVFKGISLDQDKVKALLEKSGKYVFEHDMKTSYIYAAAHKVKAYSAIKSVGAKLGPHWNNIWSKLSKVADQADKVAGVDSKPVKAQKV